MDLSELISILAWPFLPALAVSATLTSLFIRWAPRLGLIDAPSARKIHTRVTPTGGGIAIFAALILTLGIWPEIFDRGLLIYLALGFVLVALGVADDRRPLAWQVRLGIQGAVAAVAVLLVPIEGPWPFRVVAIIWIVGLTNAFNMLDNMDALSAGTAWVAAALLGTLSFTRTGRTPEFLLLAPCLALLGALAGFLWFNRPPARIFMGDAGSTFLGFFLGLRSLEPNTLDTEDCRSWLAVLFILAVPCYDLASVVILRLWQGRSPFHADKQHLSHRLVSLGLSRRMAVVVILLLGFASGLAGLLVCLVPPVWSGLFAALVAALWLAVACIEYIRHFGPGLEPSQRQEP